MNIRHILTSMALLMLPLVIHGQTIEYQGQKIELGPKCFYVDGSLSDSEAAVSPFVFNNFNEAAAALTDGSAQAPMRVYIAPWVYWIDDPDDPEIRRSPDGRVPTGLTIRCNHLQLTGMSDDARDVVLGCARGQTQGAVGNFTMLDFYGNDLTVRNLTLGNYCNVDLIYPLNPEFNRPKRNSAITQAQLAFCHGDRIFAENVRFVSRLNLCPFDGAKRILFSSCHFECTDDSLTKTGVYLNCDFDFWGRQPFGSVDRYGTVFLNCDFNICHGENMQAMSKTVGRHSLVDCRYHTTDNRQMELAWTYRPEHWLRCYQYNISLNGAPVFIGPAMPFNTILLDQSSQLSAYRLTEEDGNILYNTYNLLRGDDGWDPQHIKERVDAVSARIGKDCSLIPTCLDLSCREADVQTGSDPVAVKAQTMRHCGYAARNQKIHWKIQPGYERFVSLSSTCGDECTITASNHDDRTLVFDVIAYTDEGLEAAVTLTVRPDYIPSPDFISDPVLDISGGEATISYELDLGNRSDESIITWYRCSNNKGDGAIPVSVSRFNKPKTHYTLGTADTGHYIMAGIRPKHLRCLPGKETFVIGKSPVRKAQLRNGTPENQTIESDFSDFPCDNQTKILPGFWTIDAFKPEDTREYDWNVDLSQPCWTYGSGINGAKGYGLQQLQQGARLMYTPVNGKYSDMTVTWQVDPAKDGGQGFASARQQYLDLFINFDTSSLSGYALRIIRTTKYANAVDVLLVKYIDGHVLPISESITVDCFLTGCNLELQTEGNKLTALVYGPGRVPELADDQNVYHQAKLEAEIEPNGFGGFGLQHTSTTGTESRIMLHRVSAEWK